MAHCHGQWGGNAGGHGWQPSTLAWGGGWGWPPPLYNFPQHNNGWHGPRQVEGLLHGAQGREAATLENGTTVSGEIRWNCVEEIPFAEGREGRRATAHDQAFTEWCRQLGDRQWRESSNVHPRRVVVCRLSRCYSHSGVIMVVDATPRASDALNGYRQAMFGES